MLERFHENDRIYFSTKPVNLRSAFRGVRGIIFDVDDTLIHSERAQAEHWRVVVSRHVEQANVPSKIKMKLTEDCIASINRALEAGQSSRLMPGLYEHLKVWSHIPGIIPHGVSCAATLDRELINLRLQAIREIVDLGMVTILPGALELLRSLKETGIKVGLYTSTPRQISMTMLTGLFGDELDDLIPPDFRLFGLDVKERKPNPLGWYMVAEKMKLAPRSCLIVDDKPAIVYQAVTRALNRDTAPFGGAIAVTGSDEGSLSFLDYFYTGNSRKVARTVAVHNLSEIYVDAPSFA